MQAVSIKDLRKAYGSIVALRGISLNIDKGEFFGLLGPNGAGKTTMINILTSLCNKDYGTVKIFGQDVVADYIKARRCIGLIPQEFNFDIFAKVNKIMEFSAGYYGISPSKARPRIKALLKELGLWEKRDVPARMLSGGMKRRLMIARGLIHKPKLLILDEPTAGVDVEQRHSMWNYIRQLNKKGITILLTTHYIEEAEELCNRIAIINHGEIVAIDKKENLLNMLDTETITVQFDKSFILTKKLKSLGAEKVDERTLTINFNKREKSYDYVLKELQKIKSPIKNISSNNNKLEKIFLQLTKK